MLMIYGFIGALVLIAIYLFFVYNGLVKLRIRVEEAWSGIDVQLKRRVDLIPNLIETVKGYAAHEQQVFENVTKARSALMGAQNAKEASAADNMLTGALKSLFAVSENYPELKASENFGKLQYELSDTESKISYARQFYNGMARDFNTKLMVFPTNIIGKSLGFSSKDFFEASDADREPVEVDFSKN